MLNETLRVEVFRVDDAGIDVGKDFKFIGTADVVTITGCTITDDALVIDIAHLPWFEWLNHAC